jgi:hypothetical protein
VEEQQTEAAKSTGVALRPLSSFSNPERSESRFQLASASAPSGRQSLVAR